MAEHIYKLTDSQSPPHHEDSEYAAVGCALIDHTGDALRRMTKIIQPTDLFGFNEQTVFASCLAVAESYGCVDAVLVHEYLAESGKLAEIGGSMALAHYMDAVTLTAHAEFYARVVLKNSIRRQVIHQARELIDAAQAACAPLETLRECAHVLAKTLDIQMSALRTKDLEQGGLQ